MQVGESSAGPKMAKSTGNMAKDLDKTGDGNMAEPSANSQKTGSKNTTRTERKFTPEEALEILAKSLLILAESGVRTTLMPLYDQGKKSTGILLENVQVIDKKFVFSTGISGESTGIKPESTGKE